MKFVPLIRRARQLSKGRTVQKTTARDFARWLALFSVFVVCVLLTSPTIWEPRMPREVGEQIKAPIINQLPFGYISAEAREQHERLRQETYTRVFEYDSRIAEANRLRLEEEISRLAGLLVGRKLESHVEILRENSPEFASWTDEELANLAAMVLDERFLRLTLDVFDDVYLSDYVVSSRDRVRFVTAQDYRQVVAIQRPISGNPAAVDYPEEAMRRLRNGLRVQGDDILRLYGEEGVRATSSTDVMDLISGRVAERFVARFVEPNLRFNADSSLERYNQFPPLEPRIVPAGTILAPYILSDLQGSNSSSVLTVEYPHTINARESELLKAYGEVTFRQGMYKFIAQLLFVFLAFAIISFFVVKFGRELPFRSNTVWLLALPILLALALGRFILLIGGDSSIAGYAFPAGLIGILGVMLLDVRLATLLVTWGCLLFGLSANLTYEYVIVGLFGGFTAVASLYNIRERRDVLYAGLLIGFINAGSIIILSVIADESGPDVWLGAGIGALSGVISSLISFAVLPVFEVMFNISTDMRLLELTGLQHPLLKKMEQRAPGTLQHTLNVAKLAEAAAQVIGVNYLLVRAGVYFHDIGKLAKPEYFTENQLTPEDKRRHAELRPQMSTLIIRNHVKEGLELAEEYNLPLVIRPFIAEHHGTTLIKYFYMKAQEAAEKGAMKEAIREEDYRYPGPKPQTIESAVVMLADTVEAIATAKLSGKEVREEDLQKLVRDAISDKFNDGQFNECNLTLRDLNLIRESFVKTLRSRFHSRIDYPSAKKSVTEKKRPRDEESPASTVVSTVRESQMGPEKVRKPALPQAAKSAPEPTRFEPIQTPVLERPVTEFPDSTDSQVNDSEIHDSDDKRGRAITTGY
ncbi:MAG: HDIG domain-containing protein [Candidatus Sumerlaeia bacterium]|nr:HDIG domain-containing protein [Candidatus Sumerlaeia bacterium]